LLTRCFIFQVQSRRDGEIVRIKKHYLKVFLTGSSNTAAIVPVPVMVPPTLPKRKRDVVETTADPLIVLRPKYARKNEPHYWRGACADAAHLRDSALPSLEEAAHLFGYSSQ
jgi:hypothetical protein